MECYGKLILTKINANENEIFGKGYTGIFRKILQADTI